MSAIKTVLRNPTNTRGTRVAAKLDGKVVHTVAVNHALDLGQNHVHAAQEAAHKLGWTGGLLTSAYLEPGVHVHVWVETPKPAPVGADKFATNDDGSLKRILVETKPSSDKPANPYENDYGVKVPLAKLALVNGKWQRVYLSFFPTGSAAWVQVKGERVLIDEKA